MRTRVDDVAQRLATAKWQWACHVASEDPDRWTARIVKLRPRASKRSVNRPQKRWYGDIKKVAAVKWLQSARQGSVAEVEEWTDKG